MQSVDLPNPENEVTPVPEAPRYPNQGKRNKRRGVDVMSAYPGMYTKDGNGVIRKVKVDAGVSV